MLSAHFIVASVPSDPKIIIEFTVQRTKYCVMRNYHAKALNTKSFGRTHSIVLSILRLSITGAISHTDVKMPLYPTERIFFRIVFSYFFLYHINKNR